MKKTLIMNIVLVLLALLLASCSTLTALGSSMEKKGESYVLAESDDISGHHKVEAILIDKQTKGLSTDFFDVRLTKYSTNDVLEGYGVQFRSTCSSGEFNNAFYIDHARQKTMKIDGTIFTLESRTSSSADSVVGSTSIINKEYNLSDEMLEALRNATEISFQYYQYNNKDEVVTIDAQYLDAIKEFLN